MINAHINTTILINNVEISDIPEAISICAQRKSAGKRPPVRLEIVHDPGCNILADRTIPTRDHDCTPLSVTASGFKPISQTPERN
jgi:hypothetical protein